MVFNHAEPAGRGFADVFGFGFAGFGIVVQIREADFLEAAFRGVNHRADVRAGEVALAFRFAVVANDAVVCAQVDGLAVAVGNVKADVNQVAAFGKSINFVDFQAVGFRCAQADFNFVAFQTVLFLRSGKTDAFQNVVALCVQKLGLGNVGVFFAIVKQDERFVFVAGCFVLQEGQLAQVSAFFVDDGFDRVCGNGNRGGRGKRGFGSGFCRSSGRLLLRGLLRRIRFGAGEKMFPAGKDCH